MANYMHVISLSKCYVRCKIEFMIISNPLMPQKIKRRYRDAFTDTMDEILFTMCILISFGLIYLIAAKHNTDKSKIHSFFKYIDYFPVAKN